MGVAPPPVVGYLGITCCILVCLVQTHYANSLLPPELFTSALPSWACFPARGEALWGSLKSTGGRRRVFAACSCPCPRPCPRPMEACAAPLFSLFSLVLFQQIRLKQQPASCRQLQLLPCKVSVIVHSGKCSEAKQASCSCSAFELKSLQFGMQSLSVVTPTRGRLAASSS